MIECLNPRENVLEDFVLIDQDCTPKSLDVSMTFDLFVYLERWVFNELKSAKALLLVRLEPVTPRL